MQIKGVDHVAIRTGDVAGSVEFYRHLLGFERALSPMEKAGGTGAWLLDENGHPLVHLIGTDPAAPPPTGKTVDHVAFRCVGFDEGLRRVEALGVDYFRNEIPEMHVRQLLLDDPNGVKVELNFAGD